MDEKALEYTKQHYNKHALQHVDTEAALKARAKGPSAPLKSFHNEIKRKLIDRFAHGVDRLLDMACGRGGDLWKWIDSEIKYVKGLDLSPGEIQEAKQRYEEAKAKNIKLYGNMATVVDFADTDQLGQSEWKEEEPFDVVTCMFAIHYFFVTEKALQQFMHNVSINLKDGGYFIGTVPDGKYVNTCIKANKVYKSPMLHIEAKWEGQPQPFGSPYICAIGDTVTGGEKGTVGSYEYLVYASVLTAVAGQYGLKPVTDYNDPELEAALFKAQDKNQLLKHFRPQFPRESDASLTWASELFGAFVFQKTSGTPSAPGSNDDHSGKQQKGTKRQRSEAAGDEEDGNKSSKEKKAAKE